MTPHTVEHCIAHTILIRNLAKYKLPILTRIFNPHEFPSETLISMFAVPDTSFLCIPWARDSRCPAPSDEAWGSSFDSATRGPVRSPPRSRLHPRTRSPRLRLRRILHSRLRNLHSTGGLHDIVGINPYRYQEKKSHKFREIWKIINSQYPGIPNNPSNHDERTGNVEAVEP